MSGQLMQSQFVFGNPLTYHGSIASHFRSPRVKTAAERRSIISILEKTTFFQTDGMFLQLALSTNSNGVSTVDKIPSQLHIEECSDHLKIYIPHGEVAQEFCFAQKLPRRLVEWIMTEPSSEVIGRVDEVAVGLFKTLFTIRDELVDPILDAEGIVMVDGLDSSVTDRSVVFLFISTPMLTAHPAQDSLTPSRCRRVIDEFSFPLESEVGRTPPLHRQGLHQLTPHHWGNEVGRIPQCEDFDRSISHRRDMLRLLFSWRRFRFQSWSRTRLGSNCRGLLPRC